MQRISSQVMIAGCGPVGLTLANCLVRSKYIQSITLLDRKIPSHTRSLPDLPSQRVFSLNGPTLKLFDNLQITNLLRQNGIMQKIQVVSKQSNSFFKLQNNHAQIVQNDQIVYALMQKLQTNEYKHKINFVQDQIQSFEESQGTCEVKLKKCGGSISSELLVGSDGNKSRVKQLSNIHTYGWNYRQKAIVCTMQINKQIQNNCGYQIYHDGNVLAVLPLWGNYVSLVWSCGIPDFQHLMQLKEEEFLRKMNNVIQNANRVLRRQSTYQQIPSIQKITNKRLSFPLSTLQSSNYTKQRIALIGDAAHTIHPMAGLGVNSGIMDSILLANNIIKNIKSGHDIGDMLALGEYQSKAKMFNYTNSLALQGIKQGFEANSWILSQMRGLGLSVLEKSDSLKNLLQEAVDDQGMHYEWQIN